ncbi:mitogen-activated protein kinase [Acrasis kona]|uniref:Mitogen-activated protein kinase n=1 Tax=Acrasis kona TaxID=1008807 RepID=A0AAW2ZQC6_9EUKA
MTNYNQEINFASPTHSASNVSPLITEYVTTNVCGNMFTLPKRYEVTGAVGKGGYGTVVSAIDHKTKENVAIKKIVNLFEQDRNYQKRILREIKILRHLCGRDNIICLRDLVPPPSFEEMKDVYIVTDLMDSDMDALLRSRQFTDEAVRYFLFQILSGVKVMHSANIIHRDIKPKNILLDKKDYNMRICDFGLSRAIDSEYPFSSKYVVSRWYRAPEVILYWDKLSKAIDIWSVGCILAEMLDGKVLFQGKDFNHQLSLILAVTGSPSEKELRGCKEGIAFYRQNYPNKIPKRKLSDMYPKANPLAIKLLERMLEWDPERRITVEEALQHPYFEKMHPDGEEDEEEDDYCEPFNYNFTEDCKTEDIKKIIYEEISELQDEETDPMEDDSD